MRTLLVVETPLVLHLFLLHLEPLLCPDFLPLDVEGLLHLIFEALFLILQHLKLDRVPLLELLEGSPVLISHQLVQLLPLLVLRLVVPFFLFLKLSFQKGDLVLLRRGLWLGRESPSISRQGRLCTTTCPLRYLRIRSVYTSGRTLFVISP